MARAGATTAALAAALILATTTVGACSSGGDDDSSAAAADPPTEAVERPDGPAAELSEPLTGGNGITLVSGRPVDLSSAGFVEDEYAASGTATSYRADGDLPTDGTFALEPDASAEYRTRIVVRRPADAADFNGTVVVEWLNVSAGFDSAPDFGYTADEIVRGGYAWVGVSAQRIGIEGGAVAVSTGSMADGLAGKGLKVLDPARYGDLVHPGDAFAYDIFTQVGRAVRAGGGLGDLEPERVLAVGESQSAFALTTYVNGVQPLTLAFDGFLVHSRGGSAAPLGSPGAGIDIAGSIGGEPTRLRTDLDAPVIVVETETDLVSLLGYYPARQDDADRLRLWEIAGTAHADAYQLGEAAGIIQCPAPVNAGPQHFVVKSALRHLDTWVRDGEAPPEAPRLEIDEAGGEPTIVRDADGIALGGIRTPQVDAPTAVLSGEAPEGASIICLLLGTTTPLSAEQLAARYPSADAYEAAYADAADAAVEAGFVLDDDRDELMADADPAAVGG